MQAKQLKTLIGKLTEVLLAGHGKQAASDVERLAVALTHGDSEEFSTFIAKIKKAGITREAKDGRPLRDLLPLIERLIALLNEASAKKSAVADLQLLLDLMRQYREVSLSEFESSCRRAVASASRGKSKPGAPPMDTRQLVESYLHRLEKALGNDFIFRALYRELSADKRIGRQEAVEIASRFMEPTAPSTTRPKALQKILYRHEKLLDSRAASSTIGGKAA